MLSVHSPAGHASVNGATPSSRAPGTASSDRCGRELGKLVVEERGDVHLPDRVRGARAEVQCRHRWLLRPGTVCPDWCLRGPEAQIRPGNRTFPPPMMTGRLHGRWTVSVLGRQIDTDVVCPAPREAWDVDAASKTPTSSPRSSPRGPMPSARAAASSTRAGSTGSPTAAGSCSRWCAQRHRRDRSASRRRCRRTGASVA